MDLKNTLGLGVVGNFAGHLEQAGEAKDFNAFDHPKKEAPKGLFPFYIPGYSGKQLGQLPYSSDKIIYPDKACHLQLEAEVALYCELSYQNNQVIQVKPTHFTVFNDCSIRNNDACKLSAKKNWSAASKGISSQWIPLNNFKKGCEIDPYSLVAFMRQGTQWHQVIPASPVVEYSYFHEELIDWVSQQLNTQIETGPLESLPWVLQTAHYPKSLLLSVGATRYTDYGASNYLKIGDELFVGLVNQSKYTCSDILNQLNTESLMPNPNLVYLRQTIVCS